MDGVTLVLGDLRQPARRISTELEGLTAGGTLTHEWDAIDTADLAARNLTVERGGPGAIPEDPGLLLAIEGHAREITLLVTHFAPVPERLIARLPALRLIATLRAATDHIDVAAASARGIAVVNNPGRNANAVAEFTLALTLAHLRGIGIASHQLREGRWLPVAARSGFAELSGRRVGLVGYGQVGRRLAELLAGFGCPLSVYDPYLSQPRPPAARAVTLEELLTTADIVSLHARLSPDTRGLIGREALALMRPTAILVNTARAELVDESSLIEALETGHLAGAALDVFDSEPLPPDHPFLQLPNVTLTPHLAGSTVEAWTLAPRRLAERIALAIAALEQAPS